MDKIDILIKEIEQRIAQLENDKLIDSSKKVILIRENKKFLARCQQLFLSAVIKNGVAVCDNCKVPRTGLDVGIGKCLNCDKEL